LWACVLYLKWSGKSVDWLLATYSGAFSQTPDHLKTPTAEEAFNKNGLSQRTIRLLKDAYPDLEVSVCFVKTACYMCRPASLRSQCSCRLCCICGGWCVFMAFFPLTALGCTAMSHVLDVPLGYAFIALPHKSTDRNWFEFELGTAPDQYGLRRRQTLQARLLWLASPTCEVAVHGTPFCCACPCGAS
jgi:hypothetical protein